MFEEEEKKKEGAKALKKVYFIENPLVKLISDGKINDFFEATERTNWVTKVSSVLNLYKEVFLEIKFNLGLKERNIWLYHTLNLNYGRLELISFFLILVINFLLILSMNEDNVDDESTYYFTVVGLGLVHLILNTTFFMVFMTSRYRFLTYLENKKRQNSFDFNEFSTKVKIYFVDTLLKNSTLLYLLANMIIGIIGITNPKTTFSFVLLLISFSRFSKNANLLVSSFQNGMGQMAYLILFLIIIIWVYANVAFYFLNDNYIVPISTGKENICKSIIQCFISFFNYGVRNGGGIGDIMPKVRFEPISQYIGRFFIDMLFFIIIILLFLNMINGIIIDTFSALREDLEAKAYDVENNCFICNLDKTTLERRKINFDFHFNKQHYIKDYLLFLINVKLKKEVDLDPDETLVAKALSKNDVSFFPSEKLLDWNWTLVEKEKEVELI